MALKVTIFEGQTPLIVADVSKLDEVLQGASDEAKLRNCLGGVSLEAENGNVVTMVVGGEQTVLGFDHRSLNPPYYASRGESSDDDPKVTCYLKFQHHSEFPRKYAIPLGDGLRAVRQFLYTSDLPTCINWVEV